MNNLVAIDNVTHRNVKINLDKAESHGSELHLVPAVLPEFVHLALHYPIVLTKNGETGQFSCTAMLGFSQGENLFWKNDKWQALYVPLQVRRQPFFLGIDEKSTAELGDDQYVVCLDSKSPSIGEDGEAIFNDAGEETPFFQQAKARLGELLRGEQEMDKFIGTLLSLDLVESMSIDIKFVNEQSTRLNGLYTINQDKLAALTGEQLASLSEKNYLQAIYCMIISVGQLYALIELKNNQLTS